MVRSLFVFLALVSASISWAKDGSSSGGDGGHGVLCFDALSGIEMVRTLDSYEAKSRFGFTGTYGLVSNSDFDVQRGLEEAGRRLQQVFPPLHPVHDVIWTAMVLMRTRYNAPPFPTLDAGPLPDMLGTCSLVQLARRTNDALGSFVRLNPQWSPYLTGDELVNLWLHEAFHSWFVHKADTVAIRQAVAYLSAPEFFRRDNKYAFIRLIEGGQALRWLDFYSAVGKFPFKRDDFLLKGYVTPEIRR